MNITFINQVKKKRKEELRAKQEYFPLYALEINGDSILRTFYKNEKFSPLISQIIKKVINGINGPHLRISLPRYCFIKNVHHGYLSEKEKLISLINTIVHLHDPLENNFYKLANFNKGPKRRSRKDLDNYFNFIIYLHKVNQFVEYYQETNVFELIKCSEQFNHDLVLRKFCRLINVLLKAIERGDENISEEEMNAALAA